MMGRRLCRVAVMLLIGVAGSVAPQAQAARTSEPDVDSVLLELSTTGMVDSARPKTNESWEQLVRGKGMVKKEGIWELKTSNGTLWAFASFRPAETEYWFVLFPPESLAVPDSVLSHLLSRSTFSEVQGDLLEIGLPTTAQRESGQQGDVNKSITIALGGGRLVSSRTTIHWKEANSR